MSVAGIATTLFGYGAQNIQSHRQQFRQEFQQLGQDLQSGNLSAAKSDMAELQQLKPGSTSSNSPIAQAFNQLSTDLQAGNLSASQQDYSTLKQDFQARAAHIHHHHGGGGGGKNTISQLMEQLGQELQAGDLAGAQQSYSTLQQDFKLFAQNHSSTDSTSSTTGVSVTA